MINELEAIALLRKYADSDESYTYVLKHVQAVQKVATRIAAQCKEIDMELLRIGSLLHDIGRFSGLKGKDRIRHGLIGAEILRKEGLDESLARICERHIGVGILKEDIFEQDLPLPKQDFIPETREEKIIAYADNLIFGSEEKSFDDVLARFARELGQKHVDKAKKLKEEIESWYSP